MSTTPEQLALDIFDGDEHYASVSGPAPVAAREALAYASQCKAPSVHRVVSEPVTLDWLRWFTL